MKILSKCENEFIKNCILSKEKRFDGRSLSEGRTLEIKYGQEWGCCVVMLGNSRVLTKVSSELGEPKISTPNEGVLHINFKYPSMDLGYGRSEESNEFQWCLERCIRDSKCVDLESLCIIAGSKVWTLKIDINAINDDGNLIECSSIAAVAALAHFRRPDITVVGTEVTVHSLEDRDPVPLSLHHMPFCVKLALFNHGEKILVDPFGIEEKVCNGCYILGVNAHQELCFDHMQGVLLLQEEVITKCEDIAIKRAQVITQEIRKAIDDDNYSRATKAPIGLGNMLSDNSILGSQHPIKDFDISSIHIQSHSEVNDETEVVTVGEKEGKLISTPFQPSAAKEKVIEILKNAEHENLFEGGKNKWMYNQLISADSDTSSDDEPTLNTNMNAIKIVKQESSSEEDEERFIDGSQVDVKSSTAKSRSWYSQKQNPFGEK